MGFMDNVKKWFGAAKEGAADLAEKAEPMMEKTKDFASDAIAKAEPMLEKTKEAAAKAASSVGEKVSEMTGHKDEGAESVVEAATDEVEVAADETTEGSDG
ncbi:MAG: hypothetical protein OEM32_03295 [Acidimicrobiia bacterium]|nr:hypothetical protein [Acidimicrobiia bacterium]